MKLSSPGNEADRLRELERLGILDTESEDVFDDLAHCAAEVCGAPMALVTLLDAQRLWCKSQLGMELGAMPREESFCAHTIQQAAVLEIGDALGDERFSSIPLVVGGLKIRFYAGAPLLTREGYALGALCVLNREPGCLSRAQRVALQALSREVVAQMELRLLAADLSPRADASTGENFFKTQENFHSLVENMPDGYARCRMLYEGGEARDYVYLEVNNAFSSLSGLRDVVGRKVSEVLPGIHQSNPEILATYARVVATGLPERYETYVPALGSWFAVSVYRYEVGHFVMVFDNITARKQVEKNLRERDEMFKLMEDNITDVFWIRSKDLQQVHYISPAFERIWGRPIKNLYENPGHWVDYIVEEDRPRVVEAFRSLADGLSSIDIEYRIVRPDGEIRWVGVRGFQVRDAAGELIRHTGIVTDITERKKLETQLFHSQKMEVVGKLAGGVAHEFNSLLTAILGNSDLLLAKLPKDSPLTRNAAQIIKASEQAARLTRQLLAYGRKQFLQPVSLDLNLLLLQMKNTLDPLLGGRTEVRLVLGPTLPMVRVDTSQMEQVILNMAINAKEAMPDGGEITLETTHLHLDEETILHFLEGELKPGPYVVLSITDTGGGIRNEIKKSIFDPFFTTKDIGKGSGLGLSTCYGIIKQSGGHIRVESEPGQGARFFIYLPQVSLAEPLPGLLPDSPDFPQGHETILVVERDEALGDIVTVLLQRLGYTVLLAADGAQAMKLQRDGKNERIHLLFTDAIMPEMNGRELARSLLELSPDTQVLFTSAYTHQMVVQQGWLEPGVELLQKPFTPSALARKVREILDGGQAENFT